MAYVQNQTNQTTNGSTGETTAEKIDRLAREAEAVAQAGESIFGALSSWYYKIFPPSKAETPVAVPAPATVVPAPATAVPAPATASNYLRYLPVLGIAYFLLRK